MKTQTETGLRTRGGITEMDFTHQGNILTAVHPIYGPADSRALQTLIRQDGYKESTSAELTSFVHEYFNGSEPQAQDVTNTMGKNYFRGFTGILYVPEERVAHFIDYPEFDENSFIDRDNLLDRLDESRAQVDFEHFREGSVRWRKVAKNPYFVAWAGGEEGAEKLAELASRHPKKEAYIWVLNVSILQQPEARIATLVSHQSWDGIRLSVYSAGHGDGDIGCAFGMLNESRDK